MKGFSKTAKYYEYTLSILNMAIAPLKIKHYPLSNIARAALLIALFLNILAWFAVMYYYPTLSVKNSGLFFFTPLIFTLVFLLFLLILRFKYTLLEKYPYLISMPSFVYRLGMAKNSETEGRIFSKVFTIHALSALYIAALEIVITYATLPINGVQHLHYLTESILLIVVVFVVTVFALYRNIYNSFANPSGRRR